MQKLVLLIQISLILFLGACSNNTSASDFEAAKQECTLDDLNNRSDKFLNYLTKGEVSKAQEFYAEKHRNTGEGYGINYTFFPKNDSDAIFDIISKNKEEPFQIEPLGPYEKGRLVGFFQKFATKHTRDVDYLTKNHWNTFFVCNFVCVDGVWVISDYTCFEDSGSPFE